MAEGAAAGGASTSKQEDITLEGGGKRQRTSAMQRVLLGSSSRWRQSVVARSIPSSSLVLMSRFISPDIDERAIRHPVPHKLVLEIARAKAKRVLEIIAEEKQGEEEERPDLVICSDQVVVFKGEIREKPLNAEQAREFLRSYGETGMPAICTNGVVVTRVDTGETFEGVQTALQYFSKIPDSVIDQLIEKGDVMHCAGGFVVEDELLAPYLSFREGEFEAIMGMPVALTKSLLYRAAGLY